MHTNPQNLRTKVHAKQLHHVSLQPLSAHRPIVSVRVAELARDAIRQPVVNSSEHHSAKQVQASYLSLEGDFSSDDSWTSPAEPVLASELNCTLPPVPHPSESSRGHYSLVSELAHLEQLVAALQSLSTPSDKVAFLMQHSRVQAYLSDNRRSPLVSAFYRLPVDEQYVVVSLLAMGQEHVLTVPDSADITQLSTALSTLTTRLLRVDQFYNSIGGLLGYQARSLGLIIGGTPELRQAQQQLQSEDKRQHADATSTTVSGDGQAVSHTEPEVVQYHVPRALDLAGEGGREVGSRTAAAGLRALPTMAEIYPVGGAGDRLGLTCDITGESLPAAMLPYCGRTMLEGLMRDLTAREYLHWKVTGKQVTTPVAIMTSEAKGNHRRITALLDQLNWAGRGRSNFRIFKQPLVPVISVSDGRWLLKNMMQPMTKPGGHGAIWKLMWDEGVFDWFTSQGRTAALVRQISNPMAGMDTTLLALAGCGAARNNAAFGFMSCDRTIGAAEGCNVLQEKKVTLPDGSSRYEYGYTNIEYTEFDRLGISDQAVDSTSRRSVFPANTNVLYVGLQAAQRVIQDAINTRNPEQLMPGLIFNLKKKVAYTDPITGGKQEVKAGRMECTMQNIADFMTDSFVEPLAHKAVSKKELSTFLVYNMRRKVTSSAKKKRDPSSTKISQTPDGSFYDLQRNAWHLLQQCRVKHVPELGSVEQYLEHGPGFIFLFNPSLGPLWDVISSKLVGGSLHHGSDMILEVAEARLVDVHVQGSFQVYADNITGHSVHHLNTSTDKDSVFPDSELRTQFSDQCGRINMTNVVIRNAGIDWSAPDNIYWKQQVSRKEEVKVLLRGQSEFEAHDVVITGSHTFEVPHGYKMTLSQDAAGVLHSQLTPLAPGVPTWQWKYSMLDSGDIQLEYCTQDQVLPGRLFKPVHALSFDLSKSGDFTDLALAAASLSRSRNGALDEQLVVYGNTGEKASGLSQGAVLQASLSRSGGAPSWKHLETLHEVGITVDFCI